MSRFGDLLKIIGESAKDFSKFLGADIVADDGIFLGTISRSTFDKKSINNPTTFGNHYNSSSIFNTFGKYGGEFSKLSPFSRYSKEPPKVFLKDKKPVAVAVLSSNRYLQTKLEIVDPTELLNWLGLSVSA